MRENTRKYQSLYAVSTDDARTWSEPKELPAALTGDRHVIKHAPDGRLVVAFRDMAKASRSFGNYNADCGYSDLELLGDGTIVARRRSPESSWLQKQGALQWYRFVPHVVVFFRA
jgi:hypothetical protein